MEYLRCVVERITYQNAENGYTVLKCAAKNQNDLVTVVGTMPDTHVGFWFRNLKRHFLRLSMALKNILVPA